ncbi:hypothetical protein SAMN05444407_103225 [Chryseobacterium contaminans]|uniref:Uncharacterized protein n=1 Tax=Chryseobacterium contaminans TaxID=1423959 RepID=A0A1M6ZGB8_9FLAO|nr:hypothetical protein SAMN05444407_103225 [Chryseobacterium contaminans]
MLSTALLNVYCSSVSNNEIQGLLTSVSTILNAPPLTHP